MTLQPFSIYFFVQSVPFTRDVIEGRTSLGGSESACLGLAAALSRCGHDVHIFAVDLRLADDDPSEYAGVQWHAAEMLYATLAFAPPDVFCSLRIPHIFQQRIDARLNLLWGQDLLLAVQTLAGALPQLDAIVYVSEFHRQQWLSVDRDLIGQMPSYITRNGCDPALIAEGAIGTERLPYQFVHLSRPERGLTPLLTMWPAIRARIPDATLHLCRYDSMYDPTGWGKVCEQYDQFAAQVDGQAGGVVRHGQLTKVELYRLLHQSSLMLYPGVHDFGETGGLAFVEAQACGCPTVASYRGAAPETLGPGAGLLIDGDAMSAEYQSAFVSAVCDLADADPGRLAAMHEAGTAHVLPAYAFDTIAAEWTAWITETFMARYATHKIGVLRRLLHWDSIVAARTVAEDIIRDGGQPGTPDPVAIAATQEAIAASALCSRVIAQTEHTAADYALHAMDPVAEANTSERLNGIADLIAAETPTPATVLDMACGNGAMILCLCRRLPDVRIVGYDFSQAVLDKARAAVQAAGFTNRVELRHGTLDDVRGMYDSVFCGEYLEHVEHPDAVINRLEQHCKPSGRVHLTMPCGPCIELLRYTIPLKRSHVHAFSVEDIRHLFHGKHKGEWAYLPMGSTQRGSAYGVWHASWAPGGEPSTPLSYDHTILTSRPHQRLVASLIVKDGEDWIRKCLSTVKPVVDDIVVLNTGTTDKALAIAREYGAHVYDWPWRDDFAAARNESLRLATERHAADWILWIDTDEHLQGADALGRHLTLHTPFAGYVLRQHHLMLDADRFFDVPCRVFRTGLGIRHAGAVHEQPSCPSMDCVYPSLELPTVNIVHYGYETDQERKGKLLYRNMALLLKELRAPNPRELAWLLYIRELVTLASYEGAATLEALPPKIRERATAFLRKAVEVFRTRGFDDPAHKLHHLIVGNYQLALKWLGLGVEVEWAFAVAEQRLKGHPRPERLIAADGKEAQRWIDHKIAVWLKDLDPVVLQVRPWAQARAADHAPAPLAMATILPFPLTEERRIEPVVEG